MLCHPRVRELMIETAEREKIPYQLEVLERGGTDAGAIHLSREGKMCIRDRGRPGFSRHRRLGDPGLAGRDPLCVAVDTAALHAYHGGDVEPG